jgi:hypothetical protein
MYHSLAYSAGSFYTTVCYLGIMIFLNETAYPQNAPNAPLLILPITTPGDEKGLPTDW